MKSESTSWFDDRAIYQALESPEVPDKQRIDEIIAKSLELNGLSFDDVACLCRVDAPDLLAPVFAAAKRVKEAIYGRRIVFFAPLYISNLCKNECLYCAFRITNKEVTRRALSMEEIRTETRIILDQGHKRILMVAGEAYPGGGSFSYILEAIQAIYETRNDKGDGIRRVNVNIAPLSVEEFIELKDAGIGTYQLFQETYHKPTYEKVHVGGKKTNFGWRLNGMDRAMQAGIDDVGIGALLGLADWRFEVLGMMAHVRHLEEKFGVGCHTISVPRIEPAVGSAMAASPPSPVSDADFMKLVAILRLAVPYTGLIMSTRENPAMRNATLALGVSQISAGSATDPGGYTANRNESAAQFQLGDHRSLAEVITDVSRLGYIPSFCTACYRSGRTGHDFMDEAKPGAIKAKCGPNALATFLEYILDYMPDELRLTGRNAIQGELICMSLPEQKVARSMMEKVEKGNRDVFL